MATADITAPPREPGLGALLRRNRIDAAITAILLALYAIFIGVRPDVYTSFDIYRAFMTTLPYIGLLALAATFIVTLGEIDLSFPSVMGLSAWVYGTVFLASGSLGLGLLAALLAGAACGLVNGLIVTKIGVPSIVATIGTMFLWRGIVNVLAEGQGIPLVALRDSPLHPWVVGRLPGGIPMQFAWFLVAAAVLALIYRRHVFGSHVLFVGDNAASARMMGIPVDRVKIACFMLMGGAAALAGVVLVSEVTYFWATTGDGFLLPALAAVFIGGTSVFGGRGSIYGTFVGVLIIGSLEAGIVAMGIAGFWTQVIYGLMITVSVCIYALIMRRAG